MYGPADLFCHLVALDRESYSADIMNLLEARDVAGLMSAVKTDTVKRANAEFGRDGRGPVSVRPVGSVGLCAGFTPIVRPGTALGRRPPAAVRARSSHSTTVLHQRLARGGGIQPGQVR